jgi:hypothetical protein
MAGKTTVGVSGEEIGIKGPESGRNNCISGILKRLPSIQAAEKLGQSSKKCQGTTEQVAENSVV